MLTAALLLTLLQGAPAAAPASLDEKPAGKAIQACTEPRIHAAIAEFKDKRRAAVAAEIRTGNNAQN